jgi:hypothetical protein
MRGSVDDAEVLIDDKLTFSNHRGWGNSKRTCYD